MIRTSVRVFLIAVLVGVGLFSANLLEAQEPGITETFDDPSLPGWAHTPGVSAADGVLRVEPGNFAFHAGEWRDLTLTVRVRRIGEGELVLSFSDSDAGAYHVVVGRDFLTLQREAGGEIAELAVAAPVSIPIGEWLQLGVVVTDREHTVTLADAPVLTAVDSSPLPPGGVVFETLGEVTAEFDDLVVTAGMVAPPPEPAETEEPRPVSAPQPATDLTWVRTGGPLGGLGYDVRMRPDNPDVMYVTDAWAGVFMSTDGGQTWFSSNEGITTRTGGSGDAIPVFCLTIDPHEYDTVWVGTQNVRGIFKSTDGGRTWFERDDGVVELDGITFRGFTVDPRSSDIVYAAAELSSWVWAGEPQNGREFDLTAGVVYRTTDGGQHWEAVWRGDNLARYIWIDPRDPDVVYVSTGIFDREAANSDPVKGLPGGEGILKSTDGGQTWSHANNGLGNLYVGSLFMHPTNPDVLLAGTGNNQYYEGNGVYLSTDGGGSWQHVLWDDNINAVEFATSDPKVAYAGSAEAIYRSEDGGHTWRLVSGGGERGWGPPGVRAGFPIDFQVDPRDPNRIFANEYGGGNFVSTDGGRTWAVASAGYTGAQVRDITVDPVSGRVYAAARSGLFASDDGGGRWKGLNSPPASSMEWYVVAVDPADFQHVLAANNWNGVLLESHNAGQKWRPASRRPAENMSWRAIAFAPSDPATVYAGTSAFYSAGTFADEMPAGGVYVSRDGGASWREANDAISQDANVTAIAVDPRDPQMVYAATGNYGLLKSTDGGKSWATTNDGLPGEPTVLSVGVHPAEPNIVYVGLAFAGLYRSANGGTTWQPVAAGVSPEAMLSDVVFDPTDPQVIVAADRFSGVYRSTDGGVTWQLINTGLRTRAVNKLAFSSDGAHLYAATEGEGVFRLDLDGQPPQPAPGVTTPEAQLTPGPSPTLVLTATPTQEPGPTSVAAAPTTTPIPTEPALPTATPVPASEPSKGEGICGGAVAFPLVLVGLILFQRREK